MVLPVKTTDRFFHGLLYLLIAGISLWAGFGLINRGLEVRFIKDYLLFWEVSLNTFNAQQGRWPEFTGSNHVAYMNDLTRAMVHLGIQPPASNTATAFRYRMDKFGRDAEDIFVLCLRDRMVLFGLSEQSMLALDRSVDKHHDLKRGRVSGRPGKLQGTYIGQWRL